ncbi:MAG: hypothetical protein ABSB33_10620 [Tepidisphaeraceae bacterium]|jgi:hypothetical protein
MMLRPTYLSEKPLNDWSHSAILGDRGVAARNFADLIAARMAGTVLPFSERESLVRAAARHGINRFEANLLIAAVQYQMRIGRQRLAKPAWLGLRFSSALPVFAAIPARIFAAVQRQSRIGRQRAIANGVWPTFRFSSALATFVAVQAGIVAAIWYLISY